VEGEKDKVEGFFLPLDGVFESGICRFLKQIALVLQIH